MESLRRTKLSIGQGATPRGAYRLWSLVVPPPGLLARVRWLFLLPSLVLAFLQIPVLAFDSDASWPLRAAACVALVLLGWFRFREYRRGEPARLAFPLEAVAVLAVGLAAGPDQARGLLFANLFARSLYGAKSDVVLGWLAYASADVAILALTPAPGREISMLGEPFSLALLATLIHLLGTTLGTYDRTMERESRLRLAGTDLVANPSREQIKAVAVETARALTRDSEASVVVVEGSSSEMLVVSDDGEPLRGAIRLSWDDLQRLDPPGTPNGRADSDRGRLTAIRQSLGVAEGATVVVTPLCVQETLRGAMMVVTRARHLHEVRQGLTALGTLVALALENADLTEDLYRRRNDARFRALVQNASDIILVLDADHRVYYISPSAERILGYSMQDLLGTDAFALVHVEDAPRVREKFAGTIASPTVASLTTFRVKHHDGSWRWLESTANNRLDDPAIRGVIVNARDVTERERAEQAARLLQAITAAIAEATDLDAALEVVLHQVCEATGWTYGGAWIPTADVTQLERSAAWSSAEPSLHTFRTATAETFFRIGSGLPGRVYRSGRPEWVSDVGASTVKEFPRLAACREAGFKAAMAIPVLVGETVVVVLEFFVQESRNEDRSLIEVVSSVAAQLGSFIQRKRTEDSLRESEARLAEAQRLANLGSWVWDSRSDTVIWSDEFYRVLGLAPGAILASYERFLDAVHPSDRAVVDESICRASADHEPFDLVHRILRPDGSVRVLRSNGDVVRDGAGGVTRMQGTAQDITERQLVEERLRAGEARFRAVVRSATDAIISAEGEGIIADWNPAAEAIFGYAEDEVIGQPITVLMPERFRERQSRWIERVNADGALALGGHRLELHGLHKNGTEFPIELSLGSWQSEGRTFFSAIIRDVTERTAVEEAMRRSEERFRSLVGNSSDVITILEPDGTISYHSPAIERVLSYERNALVGQNIFSLLHPADIPTARQSLAESIASGGGLKSPLEVRVRHADGSWRWIEAIANNLLDDPAVNGFVINARDVTDRKRAEDEIRRQADLLDQAYDAIFAWEWDGPIILWNRGAERLYGYTKAEAIGRTGHDLLRTRHPEAVEDVLRVLEQEGQWEGELEHTSRDGTPVLVETRHALVQEGDQRLVLEINRDIGHRREAEESLRASEARFRALVQNGSDVITLTTADGTIRYVSPSIESALGYRPDELVGRDGFGLLHADDFDAGHGYVARALDSTGDGLTAEFQVRHRDGSWRCFEVIVNNLLDDPAVEGLVFNSRDVTDRKRFEDQMTHQAFHDAMTGLPNRALFKDRLTHALTRANSHGGRVGVLFLDLDGFKVVNDSLGHGMGDQLLALAAERLTTNVGPDATVARFGGDEFTILLEDLGDGDAPTRVAQRIADALRAPFLLGEREVFVTSSIGIALGSGTESADDLIRSADAALYTAKRNGRDHHELFLPSMTHQVSQRLEVETDLRRALARGELELHYQPVVDLTTEAVVGVEALIRWRHPDRGLVSPAEFIPLAEETGLIVPIGWWVLGEACRQAVAWDGGVAHLVGVAMSVNLSSRQFQQPDLLDRLSRILAETQLPAARLTLEITERVLVEDATHTAQALRDLGVRLAIDDFGTGYSSLAYLRQLPVNELKIDRSFIRDIGRSQATLSIVNAVMMLARGLHLDVTAEGIETAEHLRQVRTLQVPHGQGFYFAKPLPPAALEAVPIPFGGRAPTAIEASDDDAAISPVAREPVLADLAFPLRRIVS